MAEHLIQENESKANVTALATGASIALIGSIGGRGLITVSQIFLARWLGPYIFGLYAIGWTILRISSLFTPLGLDKGIIRFGAYYLNRDSALFKKVMRQSLGLASIFGLLFGIALIFFAPAIEEAYDKPGLAEVIKIFAIAVPVYAVLRVATAATRITQRTQYTVYAENILQPVTNFTLILGAFLVGWSLLGAVAAATVSFILAAILALYYVWKLFPQLKRNRYCFGTSH